MSTAITTAGETLFAQKKATAEAVNIDRIILAKIPDLDITQPVNVAQSKPATEYIVHEYAIPEEYKGFVNPNQVVYSMLLGSDIGNFQFNWLGLYSSADDVLIAVTELPLTQKWQSDPATNTLGNNLTRNFLLAFSGAKEITNITVEAKTWQIDFTARLRGIDERERQSNRDIYGRSCFFNDGFLVKKVGSDYVLKAGVGYIEGIRCVLDADTPIIFSAFPKNLFIDVALQQQGSDVVPVIVPRPVNTKTDYTDANSAQHYCIKVAALDASGAVEDLRRTEAVTSDLVEYLKQKAADAASTANTHAQDKNDPHETMVKVDAVIKEHTDRTDDPHGTLPTEGNTGEALLKTENGASWGSISTGIHGGVEMFHGAVNADGRPIDEKTGQPDLNYGVCDGRTYAAPDGRQVTTPDMRDRFPVGAGRTYSVGATGGADFVTLNTETEPNHRHGVTISNGGNIHSTSIGGGNVEWGGNGDERYIDDLSQSIGGSQAHENRPPYYSLFFIKRL